MGDLKAIVSANIIKLRTEAGLTQAALGEKLSYSDKTVSKWERAEALPDAVALKAMAGIFGVTVDAMLEPMGERSFPKPVLGADYSKSALTMAVLAGVWTLAVLTFVVMWMLGIVYPMIFAYASLISLITLLVLNSVFKCLRWHKLIVALLVAAIVVTIYLAFLSDLKLNLWQLLLVLVPAELVVFFSFRIRKKRMK